jgi:U3 small nucleolar ribonucleoprotein protein LCP5
MIEGRVVLDRIKVLESRMGYQIEKLIRVAAEGKDELEGVSFYVVITTPRRYTLSVPLAFRPHPQNLVHDEQHSDEDRDARSDVGDLDGIYRPPKLAPIPYTEIAVDKRSKR